MSEKSSTQEIFTIHTVMQPILEKIMGMAGFAGELLAIAQRPHPDDHFLFIVHVKLGEQKYVTWEYNANDQGFFSGHYFESWQGLDMPGVLRRDAAMDFAERVRRANTL